MSKYIDADRLKAKITDLCANANFYQQRAMEESDREDFVSSGGEIFAYSKVLSLINSLQQEQSEINLEKEIEVCWETYLKDAFGMPIEGRITKYEVEEIARHFYALGINA